MKPSKSIFDYAKLRGAIREHLGTEGAFANAIHRSPNYVSKCFLGKSYFDTIDVLNASAVLQIPQHEIGAYFFTKQDTTPKFTEMFEAYPSRGK